MINNKKGAIELSITTIVVVVIGITLLALGLAWVSGIFERLQGTTKGAFEKADAEIGNIFAGGAQDSPFRLSPTSISVKQGGRERAAVIVSNLGNLDVLDIQIFRPTDTWDPSGGDLGQKSDTKADAGPPTGSTTTTSVDKVNCLLSDTISYISKQYDLKSGQEAKVSVYVDVDKNAPLGNYLCKFGVNKISGLSAGSAQIEIPSLNILVTK
ncbi:hypothetical protein HYV88_04190 [Candidatus Woesearchaeota archaeon]|nr:hypothetical protein [Candidatus Woesearchaeota archaeon]